MLSDQLHETITNCRLFSRNQCGQFNLPLSQKTKSNNTWLSEVLQDHVSRCSLFFNKIWMDLDFKKGSAQVRKSSRLGLETFGSRIDLSPLNSSPGLSE